MANPEELECMAWVVIETFYYIDLIVKKDNLS